jgi:hypothetical protein
MVAALNVLILERKNYPCRWTGIYFYVWLLYFASARAERVDYLVLVLEQCQLLLGTQLVFEHYFFCLGVLPFSQIPVS